MKTERTARLLALSDELREADFDRRAGATELVLVEADGRGMTESYHEVAVPTEVQAGVLIPLKLDTNMRLGGD